MATVYNTRNFTFNKKNSTFVAMASDIQFQPSPTLVLESQRTGVQKTFVRFQTVRDDEHDVQYWEYRSLRRAHWDPPSMIVKVYND